APCRACSCRRHGSRELWASRAPSEPEWRVFYPRGHPVSAPSTRWGPAIRPCHPLLLVREGFYCERPGSCASVVYGGVVRMRGAGRPRSGGACAVVPVFTRELTAAAHGPRNELKGKA